MIDSGCFVILIYYGVVLNIFVDEVENEMTTLLFIARSVFFISIALYIYYFSRRKKHDVVIQMWLIIVVGMLAALVGQLTEVNLGISNWGTIQVSFYSFSALIIYSIWKLSVELKKRK